MLPSEPEYAEWLDLPVTQYVMKAMAKMADDQQAKWSAMAWGGNLDAMLHREAHVRADCYRAMAECTLEDWKAVNDPEA